VSYTGSWEPLVIISSFEKRAITPKRVMGFTSKLQGG
jgi:hypothetical protein